MTLASRSLGVEQGVTTCCPTCCIFSDGLHLWPECRNNPRIWGLHGRDKISTDSSQESNRPFASVYYHNVIISVHRSTVIVTPCKQPPLHPPRVSQIHASVHSEWSKAQIWHVPLEQMAVGLAGRKGMSIFIVPS